MKYFKNVELAKIYHVSEKSVRNWIESTLEGRINLELHTHNGKKYVANTEKNKLLVAKLVQKGKKFKNTRGFKVVTPKPQFYKLYSPKQVFDIVSNIDIHREVPLQYAYFNGGAKQWNDFTNHMAEEDSPNNLKNTVELLELGIKYIDDLLDGCAGVNIIDIGVGNGMPVKNTLQHFVKKGLLKRYIGIDTSKDLLEITEKNIKSWFGDKVQFEGHVRDVVYERFDDLLVQDAFSHNDGQIINIVLFLGGTIANFREPGRLLATIHDSIGKKDFFLMTRKLDDERTRRHFDIVGAGNLAINLVPGLLNIDPSYYEIEQFFNDETMAREARIKLKVDLSIEFQIDDNKKVIELNKGETVLLWQAKHQNLVQTVEQFASSSFDLVMASKSKDQEYALLLSRITSK